MSFTDRSEIIIGAAGVAALAAARVAVYGLGGVGGACALDLVRAGVGYLHVVDFDLVEESNLNRLAFGFRDAVGIPKTEAFFHAAREINPEVEVVCDTKFFGGADAGQTVARECRYHADCVDSLNSKVNLISALRREELRFISSMGTAGRIAPERLRIG
ncbi:MAG: ThiF family adenylyltransferase, partial [Rectinema sp.]|nr:ThiF family adenylyltransferase [Rectinema sp.]